MIALWSFGSLAEGCDQAMSVYRQSPFPDLIFTVPWRFPAKVVSITPQFPHSMLKNNLEYSDIMINQLTSLHKEI
jgi:hypothetical protein